MLFLGYQHKAGHFPPFCPYSNSAIKSRGGFQTRPYWRAVPPYVGSLVSACHNCWDAIRDPEEVYKIGIKWSFLKPIFLEQAIVPDHLKPKEEESTDES